MMSGWPNDNCSPRRQWRSMLKPTVRCVMTLVLRTTISIESWLVFAPSAFGWQVAGGLNGKEKQRKV
jgi:hypothetical protein